jgi:hypothetical protein
MRNSLTTFFVGLTGLAGTEAVSQIDPEVIPKAMNLLTQIVIAVVTIWQLLKKKAK